MASHVRRPLDRAVRTHAVTELYVTVAAYVRLELLPASLARPLPSRGVQHVPHLARERRRRERLLQKIEPRLEHAVMYNSVARVAGDVQHARVGSTLGEPPCQLATAHSWHHDVGHEQVNRARM